MSVLIHVVFLSRALLPSVYRQGTKGVEHKEVGIFECGQQCKWGHRADNLSKPFAMIICRALYEEHEEMGRKTLALENV